MAARRNPSETIKSAKRKNWATQPVKEMALFSDQKVLIALGAMTDE
jgi:hypothetical protein